MMSSTYQKLRTTLQDQPRRWLVTGAAGFVGASLLEELLRLGQEVVGLDNFATGKRANLEDAVAASGPTNKHRFSFIEGDLLDPGACRTACRDVDIVLHQAALGSVPRSVANPLASHEANVDGFLNLALAARDTSVQRLVYASSSSVYGDQAELPMVEDRTGRPLSPYAATKQIDEIYAGVLHRTYGLELVGLRYFNVFGRRQDLNGPYAAVIPRWIGNLLEGRPCTIFGDGTQSRDFCYIDNVVQANLLAALDGSEAAGRVYNVGNGDLTDLRQLFELIRGLVAEHWSPAAGERPRHEPRRSGDIRHSQADISRLKSIGYEPSHDIRAGLAETVHWFVRRVDHSSRA